MKTLIRAAALLLALLLLLAGCGAPEQTGPEDGPALPTAETSAAVSDGGGTEESPPDLSGPSGAADPVPSGPERTEPASVPDSDPRETPAASSETEPSAEAPTVETPDGDRPHGRHSGLCLPPHRGLLPDALRNVTEKAPLCAGRRAGPCGFFSVDSTGAQKRGPPFAGPRPCRS